MRMGVFVDRANQTINMKKSLLTLSGVLVGIMVIAQISTPPGGGSQRSMVRQYLGAVPYVEINYNSPAVIAPNGQSRKGQIWGQLVPYGMQNLQFGISPTRKDWLFYAILLLFAN